MCSIVDWNYNKLIFNLVISIQNIKPVSYISYYNVETEIIQQTISLSFNQNVFVILWTGLPSGSIYNI